MAYQISIDIGGSCLFVAEPSTAANVRDRMHVLMPAMHPGGEHGDHRHIPVLAFDAAYQADAKLDLSTGLDVYVLLRDLEARISGAGATLKICPDIADFTSISSKLAAGVLEPGNSSLITSRFTFETGRSFGVYPGACWKWQGQVRKLAHIVRWVIDMPTDPPFNLELCKLGTKDPVLEIPLQPKPGAGDVIRLNILHVPPDDLPLEKIEPMIPEDDSPAPHFAAYYALFDPPLTVPVPLFRSVDTCMPKGGSGCTKLQDAGGSPFTCMVGGVTI